MKLFEWLFKHNPGSGNPLNARASPVFVESVRPNVHILWCRNCNDVRMGKGGTCSRCQCEMWDVHKPDALMILGEEACNPGMYPAQLLQLATVYVGKDAARQAAQDAIASKVAETKRREGNAPCARGQHRPTRDGTCEYCGKAVCGHAGCGNLAGDQGLCARHRRERKAIQGWQ